MTSKYKICNSCGEKVDVEYKFCPNCKSQSFSQNAVTVRKNPPSPAVSKLLYWEEDGRYVLSKSKIFSICLFLTLMLSIVPGIPIAGMFIVALIFSLLTLLLGFAIHKIKDNPFRSTRKENGDGVALDIVHLFFFWQNKKTGEFVISKTKIISLVAFIIGVVVSFADGLAPSLFISVLMGLLFEVPTFAIGYFIHRSTNPYPTNPPKIESKKPKEVKEVKKVAEKSEVKMPQKDFIPEFENYRAKINTLKREFNAKEDVARDLIEKRFKPPQMTYTRFISIVDKSAEIFNREADSAITIINLATEDSPRVDSEIKSKINILKSIISKVDELTNELVVTMDSDDDGDVDVLIDDMENLIGSVKDYK